MIRSIKKTIAFTLALIAVLSCFVGCSSLGKPMMELGKNEITVNMFQLYLSRMKGMLCSSYNFGADALKDDFWDTVMTADGTTYNDYYTDIVLEDVKTYLAALNVFDERGLKLPDSYIDMIDDELKELMKNDAEGSKSKFNAILADYGANYKILREVKIIEKKIEYLNNDIFGANGEKIAPNLVDDYYKQNYARFKQVFLYTYDYVYETDGDGEPIYYKEDGKIAYNTSATPKQEADGTPKVDKNGDQIYIDSDGKIAYDKKKGTKKAILEDGKEKLEQFTGDKLQAVKDEAAQIYSMVSNGDYEGFDSLVDKYNLDEAMETYPNGYYVTATTDYATEVLEKLFELKAGESSIVQSNHGIHIIMRYELEENGYNKSENSDFFISTSTGNYVFMEQLKSALLVDYLEQYKENIVLDEEIFAMADIKSVGANFYY